MRWRTAMALLALLALALGPSCGGDPPGAAGDGAVADQSPADLDPAQIQLVGGHVPTLGGIVTGSGGAKPTYAIEDDGLEYLGTHGSQCSADNALCITNGGIVP